MADKTSPSSTGKGSLVKGLVSLKRACRGRGTLPGQISNSIGPWYDTSGGIMRRERAWAALRM